MTPERLATALRGPAGRGASSARAPALPRALPAGRRAEYPSADALVLLAARRVVDGAPSEPLTPLYLRRPDAVPATSTKRVT